MKVKLHRTTYIEGSVVYAFTNLDGGEVLLSCSDIEDAFEFTEMFMSSEMIDKFLQFLEGRCV